MSTLTDLMVIFEWAGVYRMPNGWSIAIRADWVDVTRGRPFGVSYALVLKDEAGNRLLGFDNSHPYDGSNPDEPFDHEHRIGKAGQAFQYRMVSVSKLVTDFFARCEALCNQSGIAFEFEEDDFNG